MEFAPVLAIGCVGVGAAFAARKVWSTERRALLAQFKAVTESLFDEGTFEAKLLVEWSGRIMAANRAASRLFQWSSAALPGERISKLIPSALSLERFVSDYRMGGALHGEGPELPGRRKDGSTFPMQLRFCDIHLGKDSMLLLTVRDLTAGKEHDTCVRELQLATSVLQYVEIPIFLADAGGMVVRHNLAFERLTGFNAKAIAAAPFWEFLAGPEHWEAAASSLQALLAGGVAEPVDTWWNRRDGTAVSVRVSMRALEAEGPEARYAMVVAAPLGQVVLNPPGPADVERMLPPAEAEPAPEPAAEAVEPDLAAQAVEEQAVEEPEWPEWDQALEFFPVEEPEIASEDVPEPALMGEWAAAAPAETETQDEVAENRDPVEPSEPVEPPVERPLPAHLDLNAAIRSMRSQYASRVSAGLKVSAILDLSLGKVFADEELVNGLVESLIWIGNEGMPQGGKVTLETTAVDLEPAEAKSEASLRGGAYAILTVRYQCAGDAPQLESLLFTPFQAAASGNLHMTLPALHGVLRASGGNLLVHQPAEGQPLVKIYFPMARSEAFLS